MAENKHVVTAEEFISLVCARVGQFDTELKAIVMDIANTVRSVMKDGVRQLTRLKLYEVSLTPFPANELALVTSVKDSSDPVAQFRRVMHWQFSLSWPSTGLASVLFPGSVPART